MGTVKISVKIHPHLWGQINFSTIFFKFLKNRYILWFLSSWIGSGASRMAPWTPWIDIKFQKKIWKNRFFGHFFHFWPLASYNRPFGPINRCWEACRLKILTGASHCLNMVFIRALGCPFMPKQGSIIGRSSIYHRYIIDISIDTAHVYVRVHTSIYIYINKKRNIYIYIYIKNLFF